MPEPLFSMTSSKRLQALRHWRWTAMTLRLRIPAGILGDFVVGKGKGAPFAFRQALHLDSPQRKQKNSLLCRKESLLLRSKFPVLLSREFWFYAIEIPRVLARQNRLRGLVL